jgi:hypothetical protein
MGMMTLTRLSTAHRLKRLTEQRLAQQVGPTDHLLAVLHHGHADHHRLHVHVAADGVAVVKHGPRDVVVVALVQGGEHHHVEGGPVEVQKQPAEQLADGVATDVRGDKAPADFPPLGGRQWQWPRGRRCGGRGEGRVEGRGSVQVRRRRRVPQSARHRLPLPARRRAVRDGIGDQRRVGAGVGSTQGLEQGAVVPALVDEVKRRTGDGKQDTHEK